MFKNKWLFIIIAFDAIAIIALAFYLFLNFSSIDINEGIVLIIIAGIVMLSVIGLMIYLTRSLNSKNNSSKNAPQ